MEAAAAGGRALVVLPSRSPFQESRFAFPARCAPIPIAQRHFFPPPRSWDSQCRRPLLRFSCCLREAQGDPATRRKRLAVFVSGSGSNFRSIHKATIDGTVLGDVVIVVSDKPECKACEYAREHGISVAYYPRTKFAPDGVSPNELVEILRHQRVDFVLLAGYLKLIPKELVEAFPRAILNIHPALLPAFGGKGFYGIKVHEAVIASGARVSGPTIHFVDEKYDHGSILAQRTVPVLETDTPQDLAARVLEQEHALYVEAVAALCEERIEWSGDGVPRMREKELA
ncbi:phosphoribosylglycinamide formyltransferase, chloroplastic [Selaginella moellendorffii]|nr:phosphoribosylglycinamide formyltransferase, chloroplastic [Selaginella moellendorffii]|eukprot:XP_002986515.2 phosphoribosylglycinamide formyltransferase, chloroplastic [Selaginella moellendorffii]